MAQLWEALVNLFRALLNLVVENQGWLLPALLLFVWVAWWLWGVHWPKMWAWLREGAWVPFVLILPVTALVWSRIAPSSCDVLGFVSLPNFWWQFGAMASLICVALLCGWIQGYFHWTPAEVNLDPPAHGHDDEHAHH